jgi:hypothetical protein
MENGREIYENYIKNEETSNDIKNAYLSIKAMLLELDDYKNMLYRVNIAAKEKISDDEFYFYSTVSDMEMCDEKKINIYFNFKTLDDIKIKIKYGDEDRNFYNKNDAFVMDFKNLTRKMKLEIFRLILVINREKSINSIKESFESFYSIVKINSDMCGDEIDDDLKYYYNQLVSAYLIRFLKTGDMTYVYDTEKVISLMKEIDFKIEYNFPDDVLVMMPYFLNRLISKYSYDEINTIKKIISKLNISPLIFHIDNVMFDKKNLEGIKH